jgi:hypothetical protein
MFAIHDKRIFLTLPTEIDIGLCDSDGVELTNLSAPGYSRQRLDTWNRQVSWGATDNWICRPKGWVLYLARTNIMLWRSYTNWNDANDIRRGDTFALTIDIDLDGMRIDEFQSKYLIDRVKPPKEGDETPPGKRIVEI